MAPRILWPLHWMVLSGQFHAPASLPQDKEPPVRIG